MDLTGPVVAHLVSAGMPADRVDVLAALLGAPELAQAQFVLHLGTGRASHFGGVQASRVHAPPLRRARAFAVRRELWKKGLFDGRHPLVVHAWTRGAAEWYLPLAATHRPLLLEVDSEADSRQIAAWSSSACMGLVCPTLTGQRRLCDLGVPAARCVLMYPAADHPRHDAARRSALRAQLRLSDRDCVVTILPPLTRRSCAFIAAWAALLFEKVHPEARLLLPFNGCERDRVRRLVAACRHEPVVRCAPANIPLPDLLATTDLAAYLPVADAPLSGVAHAMAAGCPIVATQTPAVREVLQDGENAWLCRPSDPADAARTMLQAIVNPERSRRQADRARALAGTLFAPARLLHQYRRAYANLAARRPACAND